MPDHSATHDFVCLATHAHVFVECVKDWKSRMFTHLRDARNVRCRKTYLFQLMCVSFKVPPIVVNRKQQQCGN